MGKEVFSMADVNYDLAASMSLFASTGFVRYEVCDPSRAAIGSV
jgi:hypothetical protein